jgi:hypothetical protein
VHAGRWKQAAWTPLGSHGNTLTTRFGASVAHADGFDTPKAIAGSAAEGSQSVSFHPTTPAVSIAFSRNLFLVFCFLFS